VGRHSVDENLKEFDRAMDSKGSGGSTIQPGGNAPIHDQSVTNSTERIDKRSGGIAIIGEINVG
jgi:hypothetical protein